MIGYHTGGAGPVIVIGIVGGLVIIAIPTAGGIIAAETWACSLSPARRRR